MFASLILYDARFETVKIFLKYLELSRTNHPKLSQFNISPQTQWITEASEASHEAAKAQHIMFTTTTTLNLCLKLIQNEVTLFSNQR